MLLGKGCQVCRNRIVMTSYGGLIPGQSEADFFSCSSMPRNRELMRVFSDTGLVEQLGSGMSRILKAYDKSVFRCNTKTLTATILIIADETGTQMPQLEEFQIDIAFAVVEFDFSIV